jgi:hypothetical protein
VAHISGKTYHFLQALQCCDHQLEIWLSRSPANARLLLQDPAAALQAAHLELSREAILEMIDVLTALQRKLGFDLPEPAGAA